MLAARGLFYSLFWMNELHGFFQVLKDDSLLQLQTMIQPNEELNWNLMLGILSSDLEDIESVYVYMRGRGQKVT